MAKGRTTTLVALTGASGAAYARRLMELLPGPVHLIVSENGARIADHELGEGGAEDLRGLAARVFDNDDLASPPASGSGGLFRMVIVPCSMNTLSKIACGISDNLVTRAASVCLKQDWPLVIVPRETPVSLIHLENMVRLRAAGAVVLPASPGFYNLPKRVDDLVDFVVGKVLDCLGLEDRAARVIGRWKGIESRRGDGKVEGKGKRKVERKAGVERRGRGRRKR